MKRRQLERKLELEEEERNDVSGCSFCIRRSRTLQDSRHNRYQHRRCSPHPRALTLPQRRSWPPRVSCSMLFCPRWSLPNCLASNATPNLRLECDNRASCADPTSNAACSPSSHSASRSNSVCADSCVSNESLDYSDEPSADSDPLWTPCPLPVCSSDLACNSCCLSASDNCSPSSPDCLRCLSASMDECQDALPGRPALIASSAYSETDSAPMEQVCTASSTCATSVVRTPDHHYSVPLMLSEPSDPQMSVASRPCCSCPQLIFCSVPSSLASDMCLEESFQLVSSEFSSNTASLQTNGTCDKTFCPDCLVLNYSASESDIYSEESN